ncbi:MAG: LysR family transcriptional regulator substrate-binding protein [Eubacteriales bacterium]|nr:LysR family transcriptional regulator substrate-binding protein [Eubacteriales bacterium]
MAEKNKNDQIPLQDLVGHPLITPHRRYRIEAIHQWFASIDAEPDIFCEMSDFMDAVTMVEQGGGIAVFPHTTYTPGSLVTTRVIVDPAKYAEYAIVWDRTDTMSLQAHEFLDFVRDYLHKNRPETRTPLMGFPAFQIPADARLL